MNKRSRLSKLLILSLVCGVISSLPTTNVFAATTSKSTAKANTVTTVTQTYKATLIPGTLAPGVPGVKTITAQYVNPMYNGVPIATTDSTGKKVIKVTYVNPMYNGVPMAVTK